MKRSLAISLILFGANLNFASVSNASVNAPLHKTVTINSISDVEGLISETLRMHKDGTREQISILINVMEDLPQYRTSFIIKLISRSKRNNDYASTASLFLADIACSIPGTEELILPALIERTQDINGPTETARNGILSIANKSRHLDYVISTLETLARSQDDAAQDSSCNAIELLGLIAQNVEQAEDPVIKILSDIARTDKIHGHRAKSTGQLTAIAKNIPARAQEIIGKLIDLLRAEKDEYMQKIFIYDLAYTAYLPGNTRMVILEFIRMLEDKYDDADYKTYPQLMEQAVNIFASQDLSGIDDSLKQKTAELLLCALSIRPDPQGKMFETFNEGTPFMEHKFKFMAPALCSLLGQDDISHHIINAATNINEFRATMLSAACAKLLVSPEILIIKAEDPTPQVRYIAVTRLGRLLNELRDCKDNFNLQISAPAKTTHEAKIYDLLKRLAGTDTSPDVKSIAAEIIASEGEILLKREKGPPLL